MLLLASISVFALSASFSFGRDRKSPEFLHGLTAIAGALFAAAFLPGLP